MNSPALVNSSRIPAGDPRTRIRHIAWINENAAFLGGAEQYIFETAHRLKAEGVRNTLLYDPLAKFDTSFLTPFDRAYPLIRASDQLAALDADIVYVHRIQGAGRIRAIADATDRAVRFFHDHRPLCLREHKYRTIGGDTCSQPLGARCYACLGFVGRNAEGLTLRTLKPLLQELEESRRFAGTVVASRYLRSHLIAHGFDGSRVHVAPLFAPPPPPMLVPRDDRRLAFVGQLVRGKGIDVLLDALVLLPGDVKLTLVGSGRQESELRLQVERLGLENRVLFAGELRGIARDRVVASAAAVVMPSRAPETFGLSGLEALRFATPVVASNVGGIPEWLVEGEGGLLVPSGDPIRLAGALRLIVEAPSYARTLGERGRDRWRAWFQPHHHIGALFAALGRTIS